MYFGHDGIILIKPGAVTLKEAGIKVPDQLKLSREAT
jgi:hypothetical protein